MVMASCRECRQAVSDEALICPQCGAPKPADQAWTGSGYEYRSEMELFGLPFIHIAWGRDQQGRRRVARGIIAVGRFARGLVVFGQFGIGLITVAQFGLGAVGLFQFGIAAALIGQFAAGAWAIGQFIAVLHDGLGQVVWKFPGL